MAVVATHGEEYQLKSIVSSSRLSTYKELSEQGLNEEELRHGPNHSTAYAKVNNKWFYFNDQEVTEVNQDHLEDYLRGEPCIIANEHFVVEQFAPGILIYERKKI